MNDFDKALQMAGEAAELIELALEKVISFNEGLGLTEEEEAKMQKVHDRIYLAGSVLDNAIENMKSLAPQFD